MYLPLSFIIFIQILFTDLQQMNLLLLMQGKIFGTHRKGPKHVI